MTLIMLTMFWLQPATPPTAGTSVAEKIIPIIFLLLTSIGWIAREIKHWKTNQKKAKNWDQSVIDKAVDDATEQITKIAKEWRSSYEVEHVKCEQRDRELEELRADKADLNLQLKIAREERANLEARANLVAQTNANLTGQVEEIMRRLNTLEGPK